MKSKVWYEVDPHNRLILKTPSVKSSVKRFRKVVHGCFKTDAKNRLCYEVFKSSGSNIPQKMKFSGTYSLDKKHNLIFTLDKWNNQYAGNRLELKTGIISGDGREIVFLLSSKVSGKSRSIYAMKLQGSWQADKNNRLVFGVKKENDKRDTLTLFNAWKLNKDNEIIYNCGRDGRGIVLKGSWRIVDRYRLDYILERRTKSGFDFRTSLGQIVPETKKTYIKFKVAIDISKRKKATRKITFICTYKLGKGRKIVLEASPSKNGPSFKLTKEILSQKGLAYIESFFKDRERYFGAGLAFRW